MLRVSRPSQDSRSALAIGAHDFPLDNQEPDKRQPMYDVLIVDARNQQSLVTMRSLGSRGLRVAALDTCRSAPTFASRWCQQAFSAPSYEMGAEAYFTYLEQLLDSAPTRVLIPSSDGTVALLRAHRERIERRVRVAMAQEPALGIAINKEHTLKVASQLGLTIPRGIRVQDRREVVAALREIGLPAVVKPVESWVYGKHGGTRVGPHLVTSGTEADRVVETLWQRGVQTVFVQQFLMGVRQAVTLFLARGKIHARFAQQTRRSTNPPLAGNAVLRQSIAVPEDIGDQAERLVRELDLEGIAEVEFRRDTAGTPYLMEINPRLWASTELAVRAGVDFPRLLYQWASGDKVDVMMEYRTGLWLRNLADDLVTTAATVLQHGRPGISPPASAIGEFCLDFLVPVKYEHCDWTDPLPVVTSVATFLPKALQLLGRKAIAQIRD